MSKSTKKEQREDFPSMAEMLEELGFAVITLDAPDAEVMLMNIRQRLNAEPDLRLMFMGAMSHLTFTSLSNKDMSEDRDVFLNEKDKETTRQWGEMLNKYGGYWFMRYTAEHAGGLFRNSADSRMLEFAWDGIGEWRA